MIFFFKKPLNLNFKTLKANKKRLKFFQHEKNREGNHPNHQLPSENQEASDCIKNEDLCYESEKNSRINP
jgi:hypothetical protein